MVIVTACRSLVSLDDTSPIRDSGKPFGRWISLQFAASLLVALSSLSFYNNDTNQQSSIRGALSFLARQFLSIPIETKLHTKIDQHHGVIP